MKTLLLVLMILVGIIAVSCILLMSPKGGLGTAISGIGGNEEYGSKKSLEGKLKKIALVSGIIFMILVLIYPYIN